MKKLNFVAFDFETGKNSRESAISLGMVKFVDGKKVDSFYSLICPPVLYIRPDFTDIHGLTIDDVKNAPKFFELWPKIKKFIGDFPLVAHNSPFDKSVLEATLAWYKLETPNYQYYDTLAIAKKTWPSLENHRLTYLASHFGITYNAHNALDDADTCAKILLIAAEQEKSIRSEIFG